MDTKIKESVAGRVAAWSALVASFGLSFATWVALALLAGFDQAVTVRGVTFGVALLMPVAVDGYVVTALALWMADVPEAVATFARRNTYAAAGAGVLAQSAYHGASVYADTDTAWRALLATAVGALPPAVAALSVHMRAKIRRHALLAAQAAVTRTGEIVTATAVASEVPPAAPADSDVQIGLHRDGTPAYLGLAAAATVAAASAEVPPAAPTDTADDLAAIADAVSEPASRRPSATDTVASQAERKELGKRLIRQGDPVESVMEALGAKPRTVYRWQAEVRAEQAAAGEPVRV